MATWRDFTLDSVQTAVFTPEHSAFATGRAVATILRQFGDQFEGDMQALPMPAELPPEIPRVSLQSSDGKRRLSIGPARFDSNWSRPADEPWRLLEDIVRECAQVPEHYVRQTGVRVGRVGLVVRRVCPEESPAQALIERFCNDSSQREPFNRSATFEIHNHKEYIPRRDGVDYLINSWVRCKSAQMAADDSPVVLVEQDLNTLAGDMESRRFDADQIQAFYQLAAEEADAILRVYFPE
jgi:hypothetical protein